MDGELGHRRRNNGGRSSREIFFYTTDNALSCDAVHSCFRIESLLLEGSFGGFSAKGSRYVIAGNEIANNRSL